MQKPDASLIAGFNAWKNNFGRNVMKGQKGIKILAPSPFKIKKEMEKIDPQTQKAIIGKDGKPVTEEKEITIPAFKVVSVFDVSQTEGREIPDIAVNMLTGDVEHYKDVFAALAVIAACVGFLVSLAVNTVSYFCYPKYEYGFYLFVAAASLAITLLFLSFVLPSNYSLGENAGFAVMIILVVLLIVLGVCGLSYPLRQISKNAKCSTPFRFAYSCLLYLDKESDAR